MSKSFSTGPVTEKRRQDELDWEDEQQEAREEARDRACEAFEVDLAAREFGTCKCGFKKQDHIQGHRAGARAITQPSAFTTHEHRSSMDDAEATVSAGAPASAACDAYVIDMSAPEFGTCKCGHKKTEHTKSAIFAKPKTSGGFATLQAAADREREEKAREAERERKRKEEEERSHQEFMERERKIMGAAAAAAPAPAAAAAVVQEEEEEKPLQCQAYELDLQAAKFGTCKCGADKMMHSREALNAKPQQHHRSSVTSYVEEDVEEDTGPKACDAFVLDMSAAEFGTCKCGFKKTAHSKEALFAKPISRTTPVAPKFTQSSAAAVAPPKPPVFASAPPPPAPAPAAPIREEVPEPVEEPVAAVAGGELLDPPHLYRALYDFDGQEAEDLAFREGEVIEVIEIIDQDWLRGRIGANMGVFPRDYVEPHNGDGDAVAEESVVAEEEQVISSIPEQQVFDEEPAQQEQEVLETAASSEFPFVAYAQFDFDPQSEEDLALRAGDAVTVLEYVDEQWWRGAIGSAEGIFPADFVSREGPPPPVEEAAVEEQAAPEPQVAASGGDAGLGYVIAQYDFEAESEGDLSFKEGDRIEVIEVIDENWMRGALNGAEGILPLSYVSPIAH